jgi:hypothetical protein
LSFGSDATLLKVTTPSAKTPNAITESTFMFRMIRGFFWNIFVLFCFICHNEIMIIMLLSRGVADRVPCGWRRGSKTPTTCWVLWSLSTDGKGFGSTDHLCKLQVVSYCMLEPSPSHTVTKSRWLSHYHSTSLN